MDLCEKELSQLVDQVEPARLDSLLGKKKEKHIVTGREISWFSSWTLREGALPARGQVEPARLDSLLGKKKEKHIVTGRETSWFSSWTCVRRNSPSSWTRWSRPG
jgi:hypothetical protein